VTVLNGLVLAVVDFIAELFSSPADDEDGRTDAPLHARDV
jgi:hypothetical protein